MVIENIIKEEIGLFINEFYGDDEPSIADKWYEKRLAITPDRVSNETTDDDGELIGIITHDIRGKKLMNFSYVFKNPRNLKNYGLTIRGVLLNNGDFYAMKGTQTIHDDLINFLIKKNILPSNVSQNYPADLPNEYVAVERVGVGTRNVFTTSMLYDRFPKYYREIFDRANKKHIAYKFYEKLPKENRDVDEQLDMNRAYSYHPRDLDPNRNFGRPF